MQLVSVAVPLFQTPPPTPEAEFPLTVQLVSVAVPPFHTPPPSSPGRVSVDSAVGQRGRATVPYAAAVQVSADGELVSVAVPPMPLNRPPPLTSAEFPLTVQLVSVVVPALLPTPPPYLPWFPLTVQLVSVTVPPWFATPPPPA